MDWTLTTKYAPGDKVWVAVAEHHYCSECNTRVQGPEEALRGIVERPDTLRVWFNGDGSVSTSVCDETQYTVRTQAVFPGHYAEDSIYKTKRACEKAIAERAEARQ